MAFTKNNGHQFVKSAIADFTYADFVSGTYKELIDLPANAVVIGGRLIADTAWNSATSDTLAVGDNTTAARYKAAQDVKTAAGLWALVPTGFRVTNTQLGLGITWTGVGAAPTAGAGRLEVEYIVEGSADFSQR